uniref:SUI1 domain-containing protein n=1 Tax=Oryza nivara TaxID=4536 RepID=A0A0E0HGF1_ORYNI
MPNYTFSPLYKQPGRGRRYNAAPGQVLSAFLPPLAFRLACAPPPKKRTDPFAEANAEDSGAGPGAKDYVHVRIQQRNGRKSLTTVQGLKKEYSYNKILKDLKKEFCCNGTVVQDPELGQVIQLQGDQRKNVATFLVQAGIAKKDNIKIHGF